MSLSTSNIPHKVNIKHTTPNLLLIKNIKSVQKLWKHAMIIILYENLRALMFSGTKECIDILSTHHSPLPNSAIPQFAISFGALS